MFIMFLSATLWLGSVQSANFIGFSSNERLAAWRTQISVAMPHGNHDRYTLVVIGDTKSGKPLTEFRLGPIVRRNSRGKVVRVAQGVLRAQHPRYAQALSAAKWRRTRREARFFSKQFSLDETAITLLQDLDSKFSANVVKKKIKIVGQPGLPIGFAVIARKADAGRESIGHLRVDATGASEIKGDATVYFSATGKAVALVANFTGEFHGVRAQVVVKRMNSALGTSEIGTINIIQGRLKSVRDMFLGFHGKEPTALYDKYVWSEW